MFQNFQFHFHYRVMSKNILIKAQKPQLYYLSRWLIKLSTFHAECPGSNPAWANFYFFTTKHILKCYQTVTIAACILYSKRYILFDQSYFNCSVSIDHCNAETRQPIAMLYSKGAVLFFLRISVIVEKTKSEFYHFSTFVHVYCCL